MVERPPPAAGPPAPDDGSTLRELLMAAIAKHQSNDHAGAEALYLEVLARSPDDPNALNFLGILRNHQGRNDEAVGLLERAVAVDPDYPDAWNNLGNAFGEGGRASDSEAAYRRALELNPAHAGAWNNLATVLRGLGQFEEAISAHARAIDLAPNIADVYFNYANTVRATGNLEHAVTAYRKALAIDPSHNSANVRFGYLLYLLGRREEAIGIFREWLRHEPDNPEAKHLLSACTGENVPDRASDELVRAIFDRFADSFDTKLLHELEYRAPDLVATAIRQRVAPNGDLDVLDAGCGTGLCGPHLRPFARSLVGIDLSRRMLQKAVARRVYDELREGEITAYLRDLRGEYDVIASADTLVYFGALDEVATAARGALRPGGWLVFSVERNEGCEAGYHLEPHGRYSHSGEYLERVLAAAGFESIDLEPVVLRQEAGEDVRGYVVAARATGDDPRD